MKYDVCAGAGIAGVILKCATVTRTEVIRTVRDVYLFSSGLHKIHADFFIVIKFDIPIILNTVGVLRISNTVECIWHYHCAITGENGFCCVVVNVCFSDFKRAGRYSYDSSIPTCTIETENTCINADLISTTFDVHHSAVSFCYISAKDSLCNINHQWVFSLVYDSTISSSYVVKKPAVFDSDIGGIHNIYDTTIGT